MMNQASGFVPHEVLEMHELIVGEVNAAHKMQAMLGVVHDQDLRQYMEQSLNMKQQRISMLQNLMNKAKNTSF